MISQIQMCAVTSFKQTATLTTDKKVTIVYGLNGTGKSTISNYLYDQTDPDYTECTMDDGDDDKILVYNQKFIREYFYEADNLKGIFSLSKENKEIEQSIKSAEGELAKLIERSSAIESELQTERATRVIHKDNAAEITWDIKKQYAGGDRILEYCLTGLMGKKQILFEHLCSFDKPEIEPDRGVSDIRKEVESLSGDDAQAYEPLQRVDFDGKGIENHDIFSQIVVGNEDSVISQLITHLENSDWVREGLQYLKVPEPGQSESCPFCQENTISTTVAENLHNYFDQSYTESLDLISSFLARYEEAIASLGTLETLKSHSLAESRILDLNDKYQVLEKILSKNLSEIRRKKASPSLAITLKSSASAVTDLNNVIDLVNEDIAEHNERMINVDAELAKLKQEFWQVMRWTYDQTASSWQSTDNEYATKISTKEEEKNGCTKLVNEQRQNLADLQKSTVNIDSAIDSINNGLAQLSISDFSIVKHTESLYRIARSGESNADFSSLSEGEKMIISFLYFCEICKGKQSAEETIGKKIIVIDDPISSLSHIYVFNIAQLLKMEFFSSESFEQVLVLTHSLYFFYELADANHARREETQCLVRLIKNAEGSDIKEMKYNEIQNDYQSYWSIVLDKDQPPALIANCMRNIVEYFFGFVQKAELSNIIQKPELQENRFQAFCRYINRESHSFGQNLFDFKEFDYDDFRDAFKLVFDVTGYPEHYEKMTKAFDA